MCLTSGQTVFAQQLTPEQAAEREAILEDRPYFSPEGLEAECSPSAKLVGSDNAQQIWNYFQTLGWQPNQIAGLMGNMQAESGLNPKRVQSTKTPEGDEDNVTVNGKTGYGLVQWTDQGRQQGLADKAKAAGTNSGDLKVQLDYVVDELNGGYKGSTLTPLMQTKTVEDATNIVLENYERPKYIEAERPGRLNFARGFMNLYGSGTGVTTQPTANTSGCAVAVNSGNCPAEPVDSDQIVTVSGIRVHPCVSDEVDRLVKLAATKGLKLTGGGYRSNESQISLRRQHGCGGGRVYDSSCKGSPPTAVPGRSLHERGTAIDFSCNGSLISTRSNPCFTFLRDNTSLVNLQSEPWHWSINGS